MYKLKCIRNIFLVYTVIFLTGCSNSAIALRDEPKIAQQLTTTDIKEIKRRYGGYADMFDKAWMREENGNLIIVEAKTVAHGAAIDLVTHVCHNTGCYTIRRYLQYNPVKDQMEFLASEYCDIKTHHCNISRYGKAKENGDVEEWSDSWPGTDIMSFKRKSDQMLVKGNKEFKKIPIDTVNTIIKQRKNVIRARKDDDSDFGPMFNAIILGTQKGYTEAAEQRRIEDDNQAWFLRQIDKKNQAIIKQREQNQSQNTQPPKNTNANSKKLITAPEALKNSNNTFVPYSGVRNCRNLLHCSNVYCDKYIGTKAYHECRLDCAKGLTCATSAQ